VRFVAFPATEFDSPRELHHRSKFVEICCRSLNPVSSLFIAHPAVGGGGWAQLNRFVNIGLILHT